MSPIRNPQTLGPKILFVLLLLLVTATCASSPGELLHRNPIQLPRTVAPRATQNIPLKITNNCADTIWPGIASQQGTGPGTGGFTLNPGTSKSLKVGSDWQGRVWGRTNCSFNADGSGPSSKAGGVACKTGDCNGVLNCVVTGNTPVTLAEFLLSGGVNNKQTFYDISLVDGYNIPLGLTFIPGNNPNLTDIPPNLTNAACIATTGLLTTEATSSSGPNNSYPIPYNQKTTNKDLSNWCPWNLQQYPPTKPGDGVYPYPDDNIQRPAFSPCLSACARTNKPSDCCTGSYNDPNKCKGGLYSSSAKAVCPDAYSFAFDDTTSTFIIPSGGGWEVTFCPSGRSTNILKTFGKQLSDLASTGKVSPEAMQDTQNITIIQSGGGGKERGVSLGALVVMLAWVCFW